jgi:cytochrome P450
MEAGSDTTASTLLTFCLAMNAYPDILKRCQEEIDALCVDRMPSIEDMHQLPYMRACINEVPFLFYL